MSTNTENYMEIELNFHTGKREPAFARRVNAYRSRMGAAARVETESVSMTSSGLKDYVETMPEGTILQVSADSNE